MTAVVVDTDVVSFAFKRDSRARPFRRHLLGNELLMSFMTLAELDQWALRRRWGQATREAYTVHYADRALCRLWAEVCDLAHRNGRPIGVADASHAAAALALGVPLVTHNPADYAGVERLTVVSEAT